MNPDVISAIGQLKRDGILGSEQAALFDRVARRRLVSVRFEIRMLLYAGVLLLTSGIGLLVTEHRQDVGPWALGAGIGTAAVACFAWVIRKAAPFSWGEVPSPNVAFDYVLLLGLVLFASDLGYFEVERGLLGPRWPHHLLLVAAVYVAAAYRWDSRTVLGLALTTLAAWRGISISLLSGSVWRGDAGGLRANALVLGALYVGAAALSVSLKRKAHFEEVYANGGLLLGLGALVSGVLASRMNWMAWLVTLLVAAGLVIWLSYRQGRSLYFVQGVVAAYVGLLRLIFEPFSDHTSGVPFLLAALVGSGVLALVFTAHRRMRVR